MVITVTNQKGGVSKTTTTQALGQGLALKGYKVLLIDLDPQANLSQSIGGHIRNPNIYEVLKRQASILDYEIIQNIEGLDIITSNIDLAVADMEFTQTGREYLLKQALEPLKKQAEQYDFILIDTPPALNILTVNALTTSDYVIVPLNADIFSLQGLKKLSETIDTIKEFTNPGLKVLGLLLTRYNSRAVLNRDIREILEAEAEALDTRLFNTFIREGIAIKEAQSLRENLIEYREGTNKPASDYKDLINEIEGILKGVKDNE